EEGCARSTCSKSKDTLILPGWHSPEGTTMASKIQLNTSEKMTLERLNDEYIQAYMSADVKWFLEHLADDFVCIESDGSVLDKAQFLTNTAQGPDVADYKLEKVNVRV